MITIFLTSLTFLLFVTPVFADVVYCPTDKNVQIVDNLPDLTSGLTDIYKYNEKFYFSDYYYPDSDVKVGDDLNEKNMCYKFPSGFKSMLQSSLGNLSGFRVGTIFDIANGSKIVLNTTSGFIGRMTDNSTYTILEFNDEEKSGQFTFAFDEPYIVSSLGSIYSTLSEYISYCSEPIYEWKECVNTSAKVEKRKELYLFFSSDDVQKMQLFNVDFSSFTDFQLIILTFIVNIFYLFFWIFVIILAYKLFQRIFSLFKALL